MAHIAVTLSKYARRIGLRAAYGDPGAVGTSTLLPVSSTPVVGATGMALARVIRARKK